MKVFFYRPKFHFSPEHGYMNDPNGLVYNAHTKEYHMYFQHQPDFLSNHGKHVWGHAVSTDLFHWREYPAVLPHIPTDMPASGSAVIDIHNTSGLFSEDVPPENRMVIIYAMINYTENIDWTKDGNQQVGLAYSFDGGYTYTKYNGNPVIKNIGNCYGEHFRDPKVIWLDDECGGRWLMIIGGGRLRLFTSTDLVNWKLNQEIDDAFGYEIHSECPDIFPLFADGNPHKKCWVITGLGQFYLIGDLALGENDCYRFVPESAPRRFYSGASATNAIQSFFNFPSDRRVWIGWLVDTTAEKIEGKNWNGAQTVPSEFSIRTINNKKYLCSLPIMETENMHDRLLADINETVLLSTSANPLVQLHAVTMDVQLEFEPLNADTVTFSLRCGQEEHTDIIYYCARNILEVRLDCSSKRYHCSGTAFQLPFCKGESVKIRVLADSSVLNVYVNDGVYHFSQLFYPSERSDNMSFSTEGGSVKINRLTVNTMQSALLSDEEK